MVESASAPGAARVHRGLPEEIVIWEILVRLTPKSLLRCRAVCRTWRLATSNRSFLLVHHDRQPNLPIISVGGNFLAFDHQAAAANNDQLHTVARFDEELCPQASCDGLLVLARYAIIGNRFSICNPATREHAPLGTTGCTTSIMGMYPHRPTGEYRLLLHRMTPRRLVLIDMLPDEGRIGCYVFMMGSDQPPRHVGWPETAPRRFNRQIPSLLHDNLHWYSSQCQALIVFDTIAEMFRQMRAPIAPIRSSIFEMDGTLGIYNLNNETKIVDIWMLQNYENEIWDFKCRIELPVAEIRGRFECCGGRWAMDVVLVDGDVLLLVGCGRWLLHIDSGGKLVDSFHRGGQGFHLNGVRLKQTLVPHTFFTALEGYAVNALPFICWHLRELVLLTGQAVVSS